MAKTLYVDTERLQKKIEDSGLKKSFIIDTMGISYQGFINKCKAKTPFTASEVFVLCNLLSINGDDRTLIFKPKMSNKNSTEE